jgi:DNA primase
MIDQLTIDRIIAAADVVEVIKDYVSLKKRGVNYLGLCPFHNEKTPSFSVSPSKGIYKCFGCGKGGNVVNFVMDHEQMTYVEALKFLAKKYNIEVEERELTAEDIRLRNERESLMVVTAWAQRYFTNTLHKHIEGKTIGLSYFTERGFREDIIDKFQLGYCLDDFHAFTNAAIREGYRLEYLIKSGLSISREGGDAIDRFQGRVIFPIHSISGRVIGFGGRVMKSDTKLAKYLNSPESEIYHKSKELYGMFYAKKAITQNDKCFLVEGYTDVISLHQTGIENVVASSGTALTPDQIRLIKRFTPNISVIYDGDPAGIKASLRGIDLILEEGLNVKVVLMPEGEDPDSFAQKHSSTEVLDFIAKNESDFIHFKAKLLLEEAKNDPVKRTGLIRDIVKSIAVIPENIMRSVYIKECTKILDVQEAVLYAEVANQRRARMENIYGKYQAPVYIENKPKTPSLPGFVSEIFCEEQEKEILLFLLKFGAEPFYNIADSENPNEQEIVTVGQHIISEILNDDLEFNNLIYKKVFDEYRKLLETNKTIDSRLFLNHYDSDISQVAVNLLTSPHKLSKIWEKHHAFAPDDSEFLHHAIPKSILVYKSKIMQMAIKKVNDELKNIDPKTQPSDVNDLLIRIKTLNELKNQISKELERIVL